MGITSWTSLQPPEPWMPSVPLYRPCPCTDWKQRPREIVLGPMSRVGNPGLSTLQPALLTPLCTIFENQRALPLSPRKGCGEHIRPITDPAVSAGVVCCLVRSITRDGAWWSYVSMGPFQTCTSESVLCPNPVVQRHFKCLGSSVIKCVLRAL